MQKVVNISLNGIAYQLEEPGYIQLQLHTAADPTASR